MLIVSLVSCLHNSYPIRIALGYVTETNNTVCLRHDFLVGTAGQIERGTGSLGKADAGHDVTCF